MEDKLREFLNTNFADAVVREDDFRNQQIFYIKPEKLFEVCEGLHNSDLDIKYLADITVVDWLNHENGGENRYEVVYNFYSIKNKYRFLLKVMLPEDKPIVRSVFDLWQGAFFMEQEAFDLFGITFDGHPRLVKLLTPEELEGHPLRKDYPLTWEQPKFTWNKNDPPEVIK